MYDFQTQIVYVAYCCSNLVYSIPLFDIISICDGARGLSCLSPSPFFVYVINNKWSDLNQNLHIPADTYFHINIICENAFHTFYFRYSLRKETHTKNVIVVGVVKVVYRHHRDVKKMENIKNE